MKSVRNWQRILIASIAVAAIFLLTQRLRPDPPIVRAALNVKLGQTYLEVVDAMDYPNDIWDVGGVRHAMYGSPSIVGAMTAQLRDSFGLPFANEAYFDSWPVHIQIDRQRGVDRIKRGREPIVVAP